MEIEFIHNMLIYHGSNTAVENPGILVNGHYRDFGYGFYCTNIEKQAKRWALTRHGDSIVSRYQYTSNAQLKICQFSEMTEEWLQFVVECRSGIEHDYDIVEGPMADDTVWNYVNDFLTGRISRKQFWVLAEFKHPTHQISFHTLSALDCLTYKKSEVVYDRNRKK